MFQSPPEKILGILNPLETPKNPYISKNQIFGVNPALLARNAAFAIIYMKSPAELRMSDGRP